MRFRKIGYARLLSSRIRKARIGRNSLPRRRVQMAFRNRRRRKNRKTPERKRIFRRRFKIPRTRKLRRRADGRQRAIRLLRAKAKEWNINPDKIAIMGFSAGASLAARASTNFAAQTYEPLDETDRLSARPDATCLIYPAYCSQAEKNRRFSKGRAKDGDSYDKRYEIADWNVVTKDTPPAFITQTQFDPYVDAAIAYYLALKEAKVPAQLHLLPKGQHGYKDEKVFEMYFDWLKSEGF